MSWRFDRALIVALVAAWPFLASRADADGPTVTPIRTLIMARVGEADPRLAPILRRMLEESGRFDVRICESPAGVSARMLADFDLLVDAGAGPESEQAIAGFVESGKGLLVTHGALVGRKLRSDSDRTGPPPAPAYWPARPSSRSLAPVGFLDVRTVRPDHPIMQGLKGGFRTADAIPRGLASIPTAAVLASALDKAIGKEDPVLIASTRGQGRVVCLALGHDPSALHEPDFLPMFARSAEWAGNGKVTLAADLGQPHPGDTLAQRVRGLVITGGHDHDAAFYGLFDGYKEFDRLPVLTSAAFQKEIRGKYDVVIMYDFTRELDDLGKTNLRDYVEGGGGVVVLHHALLNYQSWAWWDDEVVGGSYRLSRSGNTPSSAVKDDQQIFVTPTSDHPILDGISPFHIQDEAYKNLRMSSKIRPLLTTDNPTSDVNLAWVGPDDRFKVVAIQLGHGPSAFGHPSYRALVHNAVLWAAGKLK